ncbi:unnamed protein product [Ostreobium quekettii]|uniref:Peptidase S1 domain-containing protein n=1 Tax=Ostreobium quekettii TaxID=121088 RepID=A0A8S1JFP4_9CHLO|nr:unnamed protein product [Ostreobium quekettii]
MAFKSQLGIPLIIFAFVVPTMAHPTDGAGVAPLTGLKQPGIIGEGQFLSAVSDDRDSKWAERPKRRFPYVATITNTNGSGDCAGSFFENRSVVTTASCLQAVGSTPVVHLIMEGEGSGNRAISDGQGLKVADIATHPRWRGSIDAGFDVAVLTLPEEINIELPVLACDTSKNDDQPMLVGLSPTATAVETSPLLTVTDGDFCSSAGGMSFFMHPGGKSATPGSPIIAPDVPPRVGQHPMGSVETGWPRLDAITEVCSWANVSTESGTAVRCTNIADICDWLKEQVP